MNDKSTGDRLLKNGTHARLIYEKEINGHGFGVYRIENVGQVVLIGDLFWNWRDSKYEDSVYSLLDDEFQPKISLRWFP